MHNSFLPFKLKDTEDAPVGYYIYIYIYDIF